MNTKTIETDMKEFEQKAQAWLDGDFDQETKIKIIQLRNNDPAGFEDAFYKNLEFGTGGLRGIMHGITLPLSLSRWMTVMLVNSR